jgi:hypothetical protein
LENEEFFGIDFNDRGNKNKKDRVMNTVIDFYSEIFDNINSVWIKKALAHIIINFNRRPKRRKIEISINSDKFSQLPVKQEAKLEILYFPPSAFSVNLSRPLLAVSLNVNKKEKNIFISAIDIAKNSDIFEE